MDLSHSFKLNGPNMKNRITLFEDLETMTKLSHARFSCSMKRVNKNVPCFLEQKNSVTFEHSSITQQKEDLHIIILHES